MAKTTFYTARHLPDPLDEHWPRNAEALRELVLEDDAPAGRVLFGGGQHIRTHLLGDRPFEAIRTDNCRRILELDRDSGLVRVEAGIRWGDLREKLREEGLSLHNYRPYPEAASVGGLLAKKSAGPPHWLSGDIREGCVSLSAVSPALGVYRYLKAPRKACGPDLRHLFQGGEGRWGAILDVTLHAQKPFPARLMAWDAPGAEDAVRCMRALSDCGLRPSWCHWKRSEATFSAVFHAPTRLLDAMVHRLQGGFIARETALELAPPAITGDDEARDFRRELEWDMPEQRSRDAAPKTLAVTLSLARLGPAIDLLEHAREVEILDWSAHAATAYIEFEGASNAASLPELLSPESRQQAMDIRPIVAPERAAPEDAKAEWPRWATVLKNQFDPDHQLALGPQ